MNIPVEDRLEIEELAARYNQAIDLGDPEGWVSCYASDGEFGIESVGPWSSAVLNLGTQTWHGHRDLLAFATRVSAGPLQRHWSTNRVLTLTDDGIDAVSYMSIVYFDAPGMEGLLTGIMRDRLVKEKGRWLFRSRHISFDR